MNGIAMIGMMMVALLAKAATQRKCSICGQTDHTARTCPDKDTIARLNDKGWSDDLDAWVAERKAAVPKADGVTVYPEKMSLKPGKVARLNGVTQVLIGRAVALRKMGFHLPDGERWCVLPESMVAIIDSGSGWTFSEAKGFVQGLLTWLRAGQEVLELQATLSEEHGCMTSLVRKGQDPPMLWYGRPKRTGGRYVISGAKEDVE